MRKKDEARRKWQEQPEHAVPLRVNIWTYKFRVDPVPIGGGASMDVESSNRIEISRFVLNLVNFY